MDFLNQHSMLRKSTMFILSFIFLNKIKTKIGLPKSINDALYIPIGFRLQTLEKFDPKSNYTYLFAT